MHDISGYLRWPYFGIYDGPNQASDVTLHGFNEPMAYLTIAKIGYIKPAKVNCWISESDTHNLFVLGMKGQINGNKQAKSFHFDTHDLKNPWGFVHDL